MDLKREKFKKNWLIRP